MINQDTIVAFERDYLAGKIPVSEEEQAICDWYAVGGPQEFDNEIFHNRIREIKRIFRRWQGEMDLMRDDQEYRELIRLLIRRSHFNRDSLIRQLSEVS